MHCISPSVDAPPRPSLSCSAPNRQGAPPVHGWRRAQKEGVSAAQRAAPALANSPGSALCDFGGVAMGETCSGTTVALLTASLGAACRCFDKRPKIFHISRFARASSDAWRTSVQASPLTRSHTCSLFLRRQRAQRLFLHRRQWRARKGNSWAPRRDGGSSLARFFAGLGEAWFESPCRCSRLLLNERLELDPLVQLIQHERDRLLPITRKEKINYAYVLATRSAFLILRLLMHP